MRYIFLALVVCGLLFAVGLYLKYEYLKPAKQLSHESGRVVAKQFNPDTRQTVVSSGYSSDGKYIISTHQVGDSEKWFVIFECEHGVVFPINRQELYRKLEAGDSVTISYYEMRNSVGEVKDYDFIDASKIK